VLEWRYLEFLLCPQGVVVLYDWNIGEDKEGNCGPKRSERFEKDKEIKWEEIGRNQGKWAISEEETKKLT